MAGTAVGSMKRLAAKVGIPLEEFMARVRAGEKYCWRCRTLHDRSAFNSDDSRKDGLDPACRDSRHANDKARYVPRQRESRRGLAFVPARDGDKKQARARVNQHVTVGLLSDPNDIACFDCGDLHGGRRHEYDHYLGYAAEHQLSVQAVCSTCHAARDRKKTHCIRGHELNDANTRTTPSGDRFCVLCRRIRESNTRDAEWWRNWRAKKRTKNGASNG